MGVGLSASHQSRLTGHVIDNHNTVVVPKDWNRNRSTNASATPSAVRSLTVILDSTSPLATISLI